ncbi:MAG TPA: class I SAM-dependent methyltransferase, partial [Gemmatimonadaceae bacterium]|nr:class I SAM-dependent methyltransferase [Gemmatimonadaceae bacterium]
REAIDRRMREHYERLWSQSDPWQSDSSELDANRYLHQFALLNDRRYGRVLDAGCGSGQFARLIADISDEVVALDIAPAAIARTRKACAGKSNVSFRVHNLMEFNPAAEGPFDLVVMSESIYSLGWLYSLFDIGWLMSQFRDALREEGRFLLVNTRGKETDYLLTPWLIDTYRDLFLNLGFDLEHEETLSGIKDSVQYDILMSLFRKPIASFDNR